MAYKYQIHHIKGSDNVWADLLSRWGQPAEGRVAAVAVDDDPNERRLESNLNWRVRTLHAAGIAWPNIVEIVDAQRDVSDAVVEKTEDGVATLNGMILRSTEDNVMVTDYDKIWIPSEN